MALGYNSVVLSIVNSPMFPLLNFQFRAPIHGILASGGNHFQRKNTHAKHRKYAAINISWGKSQYKILCIQ